MTKPVYPDYETEGLSPGREASALVARLAELSGHFRLYAVDFERISEGIAEFAALLSGQLGDGQQPTPEQLEKADALRELLAEGALCSYEVRAAREFGGQIWMAIKVLQGEFVFRGGEYVDRNEFAQ